LNFSDQGGEIMMRGRNVMMGYLNNAAKTQEVFTEDGWLRTGDLGIESEDGFFRITGRIKELIVTAGGENVPPVFVEEVIKSELPCLSNVMLIGDQVKKKYFEKHILLFSSQLERLVLQKAINLIQLWQTE
jgi:long-chain-fatty-acid--CoA ligase ACSBG